MGDIFCRVLQEISDPAFITAMFFCILTFGEVLEDFAKTKTTEEVAFVFQVCGIFGIFIYGASMIFLALLYIIEKIGWIIISAIM